MPADFVGLALVALLLGLKHGFDADHLAAIDAAGAAARATAIGVDYQREGIDITVSEGAGLITAEAAVPAPLGTMRAQAVFPAEIGAAAAGEGP